MNRRVVAATRNPAKGRELAELLSPHGVEVLTLADFTVPEVEEDGDTFAANAALKASVAAGHTGLLAVADDSGLEVEALGGEPGVRSARFGGEGLDDAARNALLLQRLTGVPASRRQARFVSAVALGRPGQAAVVFTGAAAGVIAQEPLGGNGFGYDPLFYYPPLGLTFGQIPAAVKHSVSHRGRAMALAVPRLLELLAEGE